MKHRKTKIKLIQYNVQIKLYRFKMFNALLQSMQNF